MATPPIFRTFIYLRLSREDGDKSESDSISNQRKLIYSYLAQHPEFELVDEFVDDGYSGTSFERPGMKNMLHRLEDGEANCIIVKDMSRFGREYIQSGLYIQRIFPEMGVRFIAVNDGYDSLHKKPSDDLLIPIKNLMNDAYCRELSNKLRRQFQIQRSNGEFIGAFAAYGYEKSPDDKHKLVVDDYAAEVVRGIFYSKLQGQSMQKIAGDLNRNHVLSPSEYKKSRGKRYRSGFSTDTPAQWDAVTIRRILTNRLYVGDLVQGKRFKPNYKSRVMLMRPPEEWVVRRDSHEAIIDPLTFEAVQRDLQSDTRCCEDTNLVAPLSGLVVCADCGMNMIQKQVRRGNKVFRYYICSGHKKKICAASHCISLPLLENSVLCALNVYLISIMDIRRIVEQTDAKTLITLRIDRINTIISGKEAENRQDGELRVQLAELMRDGMIDSNEYQEMRQLLTQRMEHRQADVAALNQQRQELLTHSDPSLRWLRAFSQRCCFQTLRRETVLTFLHQVRVHLSKRIEVEYSSRDEYQYWKDLADAIRKEGGSNGPKNEEDTVHPDAVL